MKKTLLLAFVFFLTASYAQINSLTVSGTITTNNGPVHPAADVNVTLSGEGLEPVSTATDSNGNYIFHATLVNLPSKNLLPTDFTVGTYPNPFGEHNPRTTFLLTLPRAEDVTIEVYARDARLVKTLLDGHMTAGTHEVQWDARNNNGTRVAEGLYFYVLRTKSGHTEHGKMLYLHGQMPVKAYAPSSGLMGLHKTSGDSLDMILEMAETDSTQANQITFKVHKDGGTYTVNGTVAYKNFPPETIAQQKSMTAPEDSAAVTSPMDSLFYDFNGNDELTFTVNNLPEGSIAQLNEGRLEITAPEDYNGTLEGITITASDGQYEATTDPFSITYTPVNDAPVTEVPDITVPRGDSVKIDLKQYVNDVDNTPGEMKWQASDYDTSIVEILIDSLNQATIKSRGKNGSTPVKWTARDPDGAEGQNQAGIDIELAYLLTIKTWDPVDDGIWPNDTLTVITPDGRKQVVTDSEGTARVYVPSDTGRVLVPYNSRHYETQQGFNRVTRDGSLTLLILDPEYPLEEFVKIQGQSDIGAYVTWWDPSFFNGDTLRMVYYDKSETENGIAVLRDSIISWNEKYFPKMTPGWKLEPPKIGHNVVFYHPASLQDEIDKKLEIWDADTLPNNAGMGWIISHYGLTPSQETNDVFNNPSGPFYATRGRIVTRVTAGAGGTEFEEAATGLQTAAGEIKYGDWKRTVYGGGSYWPPFTGKGFYKGTEYVLEVLISKAKYALTPGTEIRPTRMVLPRKDTGG